MSNGISAYCLRTIRKSKDYRCEDCQKSFYYEKDLDRHLRTIFHGNQREFDCNICTKKFSRNDALLRHTRAIHKLKAC
jgi:uncharacterized Zn-finger protein